VTSHGVVAFSKVRTMLKRCAPGHKLVETEHRYFIHFNKLVYRDFPNGGHGKFEVKLGTVRNVVRYLKIDQVCAKKAIPSLPL
jgi:hypothetical protein